jgi:hypothetical protein
MNDPFIYFDEAKPTEPGYYQWLRFNQLVRNIGYNIFYLFPDMTALCIETGIREPIDSEFYELGACLGPYPYEWVYNRVKDLPVCHNLQVFQAQLLNGKYD